VVEFSLAGIREADCWVYDCNTAMSYSMHYVILKVWKYFILFTR